MLNIKKLLTKILKRLELHFYRFQITAGTISANGYLSFTNSFVTDNNVYVGSDGHSIRFGRSGFVRIECFVTVQATSTPARAWLKLNNGNFVQQNIGYGTYVTCTFSTVAQVDTSSVVNLQSVEPCTVNGGGTGPSMLMVTWIN